MGNQGWHADNIDPILAFKDETSAGDTAAVTGLQLRYISPC